MAGYVIKVTIEDTHPPVWRRIIIPERMNFEDLHNVLQTAFQWDDFHMHEFTFPKSDVCIGPKTNESSIFEPRVENEKQILVDGFLRSCKFIRYTYDFGDDWRHKIVFEKEDPDYSARCAAVIKYKGDSFEEDTGGVWAGGDCRIPFRMEETNARLQGMPFPVRRERKASKQLLEEVRMEHSLKKFPKNTSIRGMIRELMADIGKNNEPELTKKVSRWRMLYESQVEQGEMRLIKNVSRSSGAELLSQLDKVSVREYCKFIGAEVSETDGIPQCAEAFWSELKKHPEYLAYVFWPDEFKELIRLIRRPNGELDRWTECEVVERALLLGLFDYSEEMVDRSQYIVLRQTPDAEKLIAHYTDTQWKHIGRSAKEMLAKCHLVINLYSMMELPVFCEMFREYIDPSATSKELLRAVYMGGTLGGDLQSAERVGGGRYVAMRDIDMERVMREQISEKVDVEYRTFSPKERKAAESGYGYLYPVWGEYHTFLTEQYAWDSLDVEQYLHEDYCNVKQGDGAEVLWESAVRYNELESIDNYINFWQYLFGICLTTGLPKYKGHSREEYAQLKGISPVECGIYGKHSPVKKITKNTHIYEMPQELQLRIYRIVEKQDRSMAGKIKALLQELGCGNHELEYLMAEGFVFREEFAKAEKCLQAIARDLPKDKPVKEFLNFVKSGAQDIDEELSIWDMMEGKMPKADVETYRREQPKIGRNDPCPCGSGKKYKKCCGK